MPTDFPPWGKDVGDKRRIFRCEAEKGLSVGYVISQYQVWIPGSYESEEAALRAFDLDDDVLLALQARANREAGGAGGEITLAMLEAAAADPSACERGEPDRDTP